MVIQQGLLGFLNFYTGDLKRQFDKEVATDVTNHVTNTNQMHSEIINVSSVKIFPQFHSYSFPVTDLPVLYLVF